MRTMRNHYEILGLPRNATLAQIKRRYRQLARKYHPDVATDKEMAHRLFIQISEAYDVLSDSGRRRTYDATLSLEMPRPSGTASATTQQTSPRRSPSQHIKDAQWAFIQKRFTEAANHCKEALKDNPRNAQAHVILGDIYRLQGRSQSAANSYSYALQYNPQDRETEKKLTKLMGKRMSRDVVRERSVDKSAVAAVNIAWWSIAFLLIILISVYPGTPIPWLQVYIPLISTWSWNLVGLMATSSMLVGMLISSNGLVGHPDDDLIFESGNWTVIPTGLLLLIGSGFFFLGGAVFYIVVGSLQGSISRSMMITFACVVVIVLLSSVMYDPQARMQVWFFGGNVSFLSCLIGRYIGSAFKPMGDY